MATKKRKSSGGDLGSERSVMRAVNQQNRRMRKDVNEAGFGIMGFTYRDNGKLKMGTANVRGTTAAERAILAKKAKPAAASKSVTPKKKKK